MAAWWPVYAAALLILITLFIKTISARRRPLNLPPGPKSWPIIGNLNLIGPLPHRSLHSLSQKYGPIMHLQFGSRAVVVASSVEMAKQFLKTHDLSLASRPQTAAGKYLFYDNSDILFAPYGPHWRQFRKMCITDLLSTKRVESYQNIRVEEVRSLMVHLFSVAGDALVLKEHLFTLSLNIITRMLMRKKYVELDCASSEFMEMIEELFQLSGVNNAGDYIPLLQVFDFQGHLKRMKGLRRRFDLFLDKILDEHKARRVGVRDVACQEDIIDVLLQLADDPDLDVKISTTHIKGFLMDMLGGGIDTTTVTLEWAISELLKQPETIERALEELDRVIGKERWVEENDIPSLPYIDMIVKETMRLHPIAPLLGPRLSMEDCTIAGYNIPAGTIAMVNVWTIARDAGAWDMPDEFHPGRFIGKSIDVKGRDFELLPFGSGRRMCPGYNLALKVIQLGLANLLHGFALRLPENTTANELNMEERFGLSTTKKVPVVAIVEPRLPTHLYNI